MGGEVGVAGGAVVGAVGGAGVGAVGGADGGAVGGAEVGGRGTGFCLQGTCRQDSGEIDGLVFRSTIVESINSLILSEMMWLHCSQSSGRREEQAGIGS